jgi:5-bromo-4-chloroindolyl phosphate hydrolysis protein
LEKNLENFKKDYKKLEKIIKNIQDIYDFKPEIDFYIPYSVINENLFRLTLEL